ncbi:MAG: glycogen/starch synthase, partial [Bauldia sp.]|uniref:glycogen/starch synthase n=1 Tax=Bauldia sp. TaxID=2575872 RepID=UPI001D4FCC12
MTTVLSVASEAFPLIKTGGLADVVGALPAALAEYDIDMRVMLPGYPEVMAALGEPTVIRRYRNLFGTSARILAGSFDGLHLVVLDAPGFFDRPGNPYVDANGVDWPDNWRRFAAFARAAADIG